MARKQPTRQPSQTPLLCAWPLGVALFVASCGGPARPRIPEAPGRVDEPFELASDDDLREVRGQYDALELGDKLRAEKRQSLAKEYVRRIDRGLRGSDREDVIAQFEALLQLWSPSELATAHEDEVFASLAPTAEKVRQLFAKSGGDIEAAGALYARALMEPAKAEKLLADVEEIFAYANELAIAEYGAGAVRARPIVILEETLRWLPSNDVVDRLVPLYVERQKAIKSVFRRQGDDAQKILGYHGPGVLTASRNIVHALAVSGRLPEATGAINAITGIGDDAKLRSQLKDALASSDPAPWLMLSATFRGSEEADAGLAICDEAVQRFPEAAMAHYCAGESAQSLEHGLLAIRHFRAALALDPEHEEAAKALARLYEVRVSALSFSDRPLAAARWLEHFETLHDEAATRKLGLKPDLASAYAVMGRGLVSQGELEEANAFLKRSLKLRPSLPAYEFLGTIALRRGQFEAAEAHFRAALALPEGDVINLFSRAILRRHLAEALDGKLGTDGGKRERELAFGDWLQILRRYKLSEAGEAEARIEIGKLLFYLGKEEEAMNEFLAALRKNPGASDHADIVSFLLGQDEYYLAKDIFLDALGHHDVGQYFKIYMSLWILAECAARDLPADYHAEAYIRELEGTLWSVQLAQYGLGKADEKALEAMATTRGRRAELLYYRAVLGPKRGDRDVTRELLSEVVRGNMVLFFEYEMAKRRLGTL